jgi:hypothetical protein
VVLAKSQFLKVAITFYNKEHHVFISNPRTNIIEYVFTGPLRGKQKEVTYPLLTILVNQRRMLMHVLKAKDKHGWPGVGLTGAVGAWLA